MSVSHVTLVLPVPHRLPSLFMAFPPPLRKSLAVLSWLLPKTLPVCSFWRGSYQPVFNCEGPLGVAFCVVDRQGMLHARIPFRLSLLLFFLSTLFSAFHLVRPLFLFDA